MFDQLIIAINSYVAWHKHNCALIGHQYAYKDMLPNYIPYYGANYV